MATLREIRHRIRSVRNTAQITKTMEMVSAAKLRRAQTAVESARPYAKLLNEVLQNLAQASSGDVLHPAFVRREVKTRALILITSDRGLAGAFNANLVRTAEARIRETGRPARLVLLGKKGYAYFRRRNADILAFRDDMGGVADWKYAEALSRDLLERFLSGEIDEVDLVTTKFKSALSREITLETLLPLGALREAGAPARDYIFEPGPEEILARIVPYFLAMRIYTALAESAASEHGARMIAMGSATKNANEMIQNLTLHMNRTRQATITREIVEIVAGAEALK
ncbi:MAG TPA: ATP synthase F1 subunit gamma [Candidatus Eisenbacteria bacterium]|nr:ATP synthase F1 subunit gamma [Candidatus Eisenbacteria bacterium]